MTQGYYDNGTGASSDEVIMKSLNGALKTALFMEAIRNLNWSRGYCWYVELDGVPSPFQRGGVIGLPCKSVSFTLAQGESFTIPQFMTDIKIPHRVGSMDVITLDLYDDEQGTLRTFFERWYNQIYNPYRGVLPVSEACKHISIYFQKTTRRNVKRVIFNLDTNLSALSSMRSTQGYDFLVYPSGPVRLQLDSSQSDIISFTVQLEIAQFMNQDFGNPNTTDAVLSALGIDVYASNRDSWLDKLADYI